MKATKEQVDRALKKLARAMGKWNYPTTGDRSSLDSALFDAAWEVINKTGHYKHYKTAVNAEFKKHKEQT